MSGRLPDESAMAEQAGRPDQQILKSGILVVGPGLLSRLSEYFHTACEARGYSF